MNNILLIAPYEDLKETAERIVKENSLNVDVVQGNLSNGVRIAKEAERNGVEVIITRGGTFQAIKQVVEIPVVEIQVTAFDILRAFKDLKYNKDPIGIVGYGNVVFGIDTLTEVLGLNLYKVIFNSEDEAPRQVFQVASKGVKEFVGDAIGIKTVRDMGLKGHLIASGREAILSAIDEAIRALQIRTEERAKAKRFSIIMDFISDGIVAVDYKENVTIFNKMAEQIFDKAESPVGRPVNEVLTNTRFLEVLRTGKSQIGELQRVGDTVIASSSFPVVVDNKTIGAVATFQDVTQIQKLEHKIRRELYQKGLVAKYSFDDIEFKSRSMAETVEKAEKYARLDSTTALILGETGTGKELFANSIHNASPRSKRPFVAINCAALPENLLESELFGYAEGAFTGARKGGKMGLFEMAHTGTVFLDEIGDMPLNLQSRLLRVLQEKEVMRIGDDRVIPVDVRIIASTNVDLKKDVEMGKFRRDLFYRLNILTLTVPPLRERKEDILLLVRTFIGKYSQKMGKDIVGLTEEAKNLLVNMDYQGNVRELKGIIERAMAFAEGRYIDVKDMGNLKNDVKTTTNHVYNGMTLKEIEATAIKEALDAAGGSMSKAASLLGVDRTTIWRKMKEI